MSDLVILGEGSSGVVYRGLYRGMACVVKLPKAVALSGAAWREWQCHMSLPPHPQLVHFLGALPMSSTTYLVLGFVRQGSLHSLLVTSSCYSRPYGVMRCMRDVSAALHHMHRAGIVHRDVSCRNILADSDGSMVLADLGLATLLAVSDESTQQTAVPVRWTSPESLHTSHHSGKSDVWSLGVAMWECTAGGATPYADQQRNTKHCIRPIIAGDMRLSVDDTWGMAGGGSGGVSGVSGVSGSGSSSGGHVGTSGSASDSSSSGSAGGSTSTSSSSITRAEQLLARRVRLLIALCLTYSVEQRPDSEQLVALVERSWQEWREEAGSGAEQLDDEWAAYHAEVQRRLGPPSSRQQQQPSVL